MVRRINLKHANVARSNTIRDINRQIILNFIREQGPISRAEISKVTALQRSTVSLIVEELLNTSLIEEIYGESSGGRPPQLLSLKTSQAFAIGVDIGQKTTVIATADLAGHPLEREEFPTGKDLDRTFERVIEICSAMKARNAGAIEGIGVSLPGMVDSWTGDVLLVPHLGWRGPGTGEKISRAVGLPVKIENDANAAALAELWFGRPEISNIRDFILVYITSGIGTGVVFDGQIYRGKDGIAGEFGHMTVGASAPVACAAGSDSCWEAFASERAAVARYEKLSGAANATARILFADLVERALKGDAKAIAALRETAHYIGVGISNLVQGLSPEITIVTGAIVRAWDLIADDINKAATDAICQGYPTVRIMPSTLGSYPTLMGAFSLVLADKFASVAVT